MGEEVGWRSDEATYMKLSYMQDDFPDLDWGRGLCLRGMPSPAFMWFFLGPLKEVPRADLRRIAFRAFVSTPDNEDFAQVITAAEGNYLMLWGTDLVLRSSVMVAGVRLPLCAVGTAQDQHRYNFMLLMPDVCAVRS